MNLSGKKGTDLKHFVQEPSKRAIVSRGHRVDPLRRGPGKGKDKKRAFCERGCRRDSWPRPARHSIE